MEKELKDKIKHAITLQEQHTLFNNNSDDSLEQACVEFLKFKGYRISNPIDFKYNIKSLNDLVKFFYTMLDAKHPEYVDVYRNFGRDLKIASTFVKNRVATTGNSEKIALKECAAIIDTVFKYEKQFKFNTNIYFGMFGQANLSWVSRLAVDIMNKNQREKVEEEGRLEMEKVEKEQQVNFELGFDDIDDIINRMEQEEINGKKERTN
jgi:hypothetical protein